VITPAIPGGAEIEEGRLYGVGAADAKAQIAAFVYATRTLREAGITLAGNVTLAFVVDEEPGGMLTLRYAVPA
jgi:acetylornithine deacetylase/succinyl-diaminopimelate desuccinylase-like protein